MLVNWRQPPWLKSGKKWVWIVLASSFALHCTQTQETGAPPTADQLLKTSPIVPMKPPRSSDPFEGWDKEQRRVFMVNFSRDLNAECSDCHDGDDVDRVVKYKDVTLSMTHLARTFSVECRFCHTTISDLNHMGQISLQMKKDYSDKLEVPCTYCHTAGTVFKLNAEGLREQRKLKAQKNTR